MAPFSEFSSDFQFGLMLDGNRRADGRLHSLAVHLPYCNCSHFRRLAPHRDIRLQAVTAQYVLSRVSLLRLSSGRESEFSSDHGLCVVANRQSFLPT